MDQRAKQATQWRIYMHVNKHENLFHTVCYQGTAVSHHNTLIWKARTLNTEHTNEAESMEQHEIKFIAGETAKY
jgi:hypothetical protein